MRKNRKLLGLMSLVGLLAGSALFGQGITYSGRFSQISASSGCEKVFARTDYLAEHFLVGPNRLTSVVHFAEADGFFAGMNIVGNMGYNNDIYAKKEFSQDGVRYRLVLEGIVDYMFILFTLNVAAVDIHGRVLCAAEAEYYGSQKGI